MILCVSVLSAVISPFSLLILLIWFLSLCFLMNLVNGLSVLFILSKNQLLALWIFAMVSFVSFAFTSALIFKISFLLLTLGSSFLPFLVALGVELGYLFGFFLFLWVCLYCYEPSLSTAFTVSHRFWVVLFHFHSFLCIFWFFFYFFCGLLVIQQHVVQPPYVGIFNSFSHVIDI